MYSEMPTKRKISIFLGFGWPSIPVSDKNYGNFKYFSLKSEVNEDNCSCNMNLTLVNPLSHHANKSV